jgi:hypothetical protein
VSDGRLTDAELKAIRARAEADHEYWQRHTDLKPSGEEADRAALLAALDSALADLAAAEGALHDLTSPQSGEANAAYLRGVEDERARCAALLRLTAGDHRRFLPQATPGAQRLVVASVADALDSTATEVESPPAPAAPPREES